MWMVCIEMHIFDVIRVRMINIFDVIRVLM